MAQSREQHIHAEGMDDLWNVWYTELNQGKAGLTLKVSRLVESITSPFQRIDVIETEQYGKALVLYGSLMAAERDTDAYNEMIAHVPLMVHPHPNEVLVIGGGDGGCITNVFMHPEVKRSTMCEIDEKVVEVSKRHFPRLTRGLSDPRLRLVFMDGKNFIDQAKEQFDVIMLDLSDPVGPAAELFQMPFHRKVYEKLNDDGIMIAQSESPLYHGYAIRPLYDNLKKIFPIVRMYTCFMPIYPSGFWSFAFCSKKYDPLEDFQHRRYEQTDLSGCNYYNKDVHFGAFALPRFVKKLLE